MAPGLRWDGDAPGYVADVCANGLAGALIAEVAPRGGEPFVFKQRYSAFDSTPLAILLERLGIERILLAGNATEMCVTQTAISARELGFKVTVLADCCATLDAELEEIALDYLERVVGAHVERRYDLAAAAGRSDGGDDQPRRRGKRGEHVR